MNEKGKFIVFEGIDGSGKSSVAAAVVQKLGKSCVLTAEPHKTGLLGQMLRTFVLTNADKMSSLCQMMLFEAARAEHVSRYINPALQSGNNVICDRFSASTLAYQGFGMGESIGVIRELNQIAQQGLEPDLTVWFDVDVKTGIERNKGENSLDNQSFVFYEKVRRGYSHLYKAYPDWVRVDAARPLEDVIDETYRVVVDCIQKK